MITPLRTLYDNSASPECLARFDKTTFTETQIASFDEQRVAIIRKQEAYKAAHPVIAIYRLATEGSRTRNGGEIQKASSPLTFSLPDGSEVRAALKGDYVVYPDGCTAQIISGTGSENSDMALVGSRLSNGDEIVNTPQDIGVWTQRSGEQMAGDFLPTDV